MDSEPLLDALDTYEDNIEHLSSVLAPLLNDGYTTTLKKLPVLDRAKLNITVVYALETLIFNYLKTSSIDPSTHPIMKELQRTKTYFAKLKAAEESMQPSAPTVSLNKQAAQRIIQHNLTATPNTSTDTPAGASRMTREEHEAAQKALQDRIAQSRAELARKEREARARFLAKKKERAAAATESIAVSDLDRSNQAHADVSMQDDRDRERAGSEDGEIEDVA